MLNQKVLFTKDECEWILTHAKEYRTSTVSYDSERDPNLTRILNTRTRISEDCELGEPQGELAEFLLERLKPLGFVNLDGASLNFVRYFKGGFFASHTDGPVRYKTCIIQLTPENEYKGGDLVVGKEVVSKEAGNSVIFGSNTIHELKLVEEGQRDVLVVWTKKRNIKEIKSLI